MTSTVAVPPAGTEPTRIPIRCSVSPPIFSDALVASTAEPLSCVAVTSADDESLSVNVEAELADTFLTTNLAFAVAFRSAAAAGI